MCSGEEETVSLQRGKQSEGDREDGVEGGGTLTAATGSHGATCFLILIFVSLSRILANLHL